MRKVWLALGLALAGCGAAAVGAADPTDVEEVATVEGLPECVDDEPEAHYLYVAEGAFVLADSGGRASRVEAGARPRDTLEAATRELRRRSPEIVRLHVIVDAYVSDGEADDAVEVLRAEGLRSARCRPSARTPYGSVREAVSAAESQR